MMQFWKNIGILCRHHALSLLPLNQGSHDYEFYNYYL